MGFPSRLCSARLLGVVSCWACFLVLLLRCVLGACSLGWGLQGASSPSAFPSGQPCPLPNLRVRLFGGGGTCGVGGGRMFTPRLHRLTCVCVCFGLVLVVWPPRHTSGSSLRPASVVRLLVVACLLLRVGAAGGSGELGAEPQRARRAGTTQVASPPSRQNVPRGRCLGWGVEAGGREGS